MSICKHYNTCPDRAILSTAYPCFCCPKRDKPIHEFVELHNNNPIGGFMPPKPPQQPQPMTNGDKLRQLDDGGLAKALDRLAQNVINGNYCDMLGMEGNEKPSCFSKDDNSGCLECVLKWLRSPSGERT